MFCRLLPGSGGQQVRSTVPLPPRTAVNEQQIDMPVFPNEFLCACDYELECTVSDELECTVSDELECTISDELECTISDGQRISF